MGRRSASLKPASGKPGKERLNLKGKLRLSWKHARGERQAPGAGRGLTSTYIRLPNRLEVKAKGGKSTIERSCRDRLGRVFCTLNSILLKVE
jgi:hypothetical protein